MDFSKAYTTLNENQKLAVDTIEGPVMVVAGPGTGKTQVLAMRIANILQQVDITGNNILALTFTESGAMAMKERLVSLVGPAGYYVQIATFHSFCSDIIARNPDRFNMSEESTGISELERLQLASTIVAREKLTKLKPTGAPELYVRAILKSIQDLKREAVTPERFTQLVDEETGADREKLQELAHVYALYEQELKQIHRYDFEDMIGLVRRAWQEDPAFLRRFQEQYLYLLADEYQDTNTSQNQLLFLLSDYWEDKANIFVVGDPDQAIYRFQGASMENLLDFKARYPQAHVIRLDKNYRSVQGILNGSHQLIAQNSWGSWTFFAEESAQFQPLQSVHTDTKTPIPITHVEFPNDTLEQLFIVDHIKQELAQGTKASGIAVLYRDNAHGAFLADLLTREKIPVVLESNESVLHKNSVERLVTIIKAVAQIKHQEDGLALLTLLWYDFLTLDRLDVMMLVREAKDKRKKLADFILHRGYAKLSLTNSNAFDTFQQKLLHWVQQSENLRMDAWVDLLLHESGLMTWILQQPNNMRLLTQIQSFTRWIRSQVNTTPDLSLGGLLNRMTLMDRYHLGIPETNLEIETEAVTLCTAHRSKGREWDVVFLYQAADGVWGNRRVSELIKLPPMLGTQALLDKKEKNEDERRLFYVAMTRAKHRLWITNAKEYEDKSSMASMFVHEIGTAVHVREFKDWETDLSTFGKRLFSIPQTQEISIAEQTYLKHILKDFVLSASALNTYLACPYVFKLQYLLKLPSFPSPAMAYGSAVHAAMEGYYREYMQSGSAPDPRVLEQVFLQSMEKEWTHAGDFDAWKDRGLKALQLYWQTWHQDMKPGLLSERFFGTTKRPLFLEGIALQGKIDRIEMVDMDRKNVRIVDFKTGRPKTRNEILGKTANSDGSYKRQLLFYALLTSLDPNFTYRASEMQLDFVEAGYNGKLKKETFSVESQEIDKLKNTIIEVINKIRNLEFGHPADCAVCAESDWKTIIFPHGLPRTVVMNGEQMVLF